MNNPPTESVTITKAMEAMMKLNPRHVSFENSDMFAQEVLSVRYTLEDHCFFLKCCCDPRLRQTVPEDFVTDCQRRSWRPKL